MNDYKEKSPTKKTNKGFKVFSIFVIVIAIIFAGAGLGFLTASLNTKPGLIDDIRPPASSQIYDINGKLITNIHSEQNRIPVKLSKVPKNLQEAFIAVEDARFYQHSGIDPRGILRAVWSNITNRGVAEGGSTITQQLAKNAYLSQEQTLKRKIQEVFLALQIERNYTKNEILELYLNQIYFGQGAYGVEAASQVYFNKNVEDITLAEAAMLAGIPKSPNYYSPLNNLKASQDRKNVVLSQMEKYGYINASKAAEAKNEKINISTKHAPTKESNQSKFASYFVDYVTQILVEKYGADAIYKDGLQVYTTIDMDMQTAAENAMAKLPTYRTDSNNVRQPQGALVAIDPQTGYIKAMVGGRGDDQFNRATMAERQPGSAFKPFVFLAAIESNMSPGTILDDSPVSFGSWSPVNYNGKFNGKVNLRTVVENSLNVPTVKLTQEIGVDKPLYYAEKMGISTLVLDGPQTDRNLAMALGGLTRGVTPMELASAYGVFANQGKHAKPIAILKILDRNGKVLEQSSIKDSKVISPASAYTITDMLKGVVTRGTGTAANIGRPAAGKTGTTSDYKDAWFVGYTPNLVASVWVGNDNNENLAGVTGGALPAQIWRSFMEKAVQGLPNRDFNRPDGLVLDSTSMSLDASEKPKDGEDKDKTTDPKKEQDKDKLTKDADKNNTKTNSETKEPVIKNNDNKASNPATSANDSTGAAAPPPLDKTN